MRQSSLIIYILTFIISIATGMFDLPAGIFMIAIVICSLLYARIGPKSSRTERFSLGAIITLIYIVSSMICSTCFDETRFYLASDPIRYIAMVHRTHDFRPIFDELEKSYILFADNNGLYNSMLRLLGILCRNNGYVASPLLVTLPQTLFGILTIQTVFRIINLKFTPKKTYKYTLIYGTCSLILLYSGIIVRDVVIAFVFAVCIETVMKPFNIRGLVILGVAMILCIGLRLFSGLFISIFILYYVFFNVKSGFGKLIIYPIAAIAILTVARSAFAEEMLTRTADEIEGYSQWQSDIANKEDGFSSQLRKLPSGISNVALSLFSQMNPFPPYSTLLNPHLDPAKIYMSCLMTLSAIWWFFVSYSLLWFFFFKKGYKRLGARYNCLFAIAWLLIVVSSSMHVDIRRITPVYPIIYFLFLYCTNYLYTRQQVRQVYQTLGVGYVALNVLYLIIK